MGMRNGLSMCRFCSGMCRASALNNWLMQALIVGSVGLSSAPLALPRMNGTDGTQGMTEGSQRTGVECCVSAWHSDGATFRLRCVGISLDFMRNRRESHYFVGCY